MCTIELRRGENRYPNARAQIGMFMIVESVAEIERRSMSCKSRTIEWYRVGKETVSRRRKRVGR